ncbi:MAG: hypothetical protein AAFO95_12540 [Cyanobacteria bacterium J06600_6]
MTIDPLLGTWLLVGSVSYRSELEIVNGKREPMGVTNWLNGKGGDPSPEIISTSGLTLTITKTGFQEERTGNPDIQWFNTRGELSDVQPFEGTVSFHGSKVYLIANNIPKWSKPSSKQGQKKYRYADGDTTISETVEIRADEMVRTMNVVTDLIYFDRVILIYQRKKEKVNDK